MSNYDQSYAGPVDWLTVWNDDDGYTTRVNLSFLASNWKCIYGQGCPGIFPKSATTIAPDIACCMDGFYMVDQDDYNTVDKHVGMLTPDDWDSELQREYTRTGKWAIARRPFTGDDEEDDGKSNVKSRVIRGGCIFANRADGSVGSTGKIGCAFLHMGNRLNAGEHDIFDNSEEHKNYMPHVCSTVPIKTYWNDAGEWVIDAWSVDMWRIDRWPFDEDGASDSFTHWWCVDSADAYVAKDMVVDRMRRELIDYLGDELYETVRSSIHARKDAIHPMPVSPRGRKQLPMVPAQTIKEQVGDRKPIRELPKRS